MIFSHHMCKEAGYSSNKITVLDEKHIPFLFQTYRHGGKFVPQTDVRGRDLNTTAPIPNEPSTSRHRKQNRLQQ